MTRLRSTVAARALHNARHPRSEWIDRAWSDGWQVDQSGDEVVVWWDAPPGSEDLAVEAQRLAAYTATLERAGLRVENVARPTMGGPAGRRKLVVSQVHGE